MPQLPLRSHAGPPGQRRRLPTLLLLLLLALTALPGCARVQAALAVQADDTVVGEVVVATPELGPDHVGPVITLPPDLAAADVEIGPYRQDGYTGSVVRFSGLTFEQVSRLAAAAGPDGEKLRIELRRAGNRVIVDGEVDLTSVSVDRADFQLLISFPGRVLESNGDADTGTVGWTFEPGAVGDIETVVAFEDPTAPSVLNWTLVLAGLVALAALAVVLLARHTRNPPLTPPIR